jgi:hypothetical protein
MAVGAIALGATVSISAIIIQNSSTCFGNERSEFPKQVLNHESIKQFFCL